jgi:hypothetical protein
MNYHEYSHTVDIMQYLAGANDFVTLKSIGYSYDMTGLSPEFSYEIYAMRIGPVGVQDIQDDGDNIPSILFVGGIHGREWLTSESVLQLALHLVNRLHHRDSEEYALLQRVAVWIIPIANPAGRMIDDENFGDPEDFYRGAGRTAGGWRHNGDTRGCEAATDIARNFSTGWGGGPHPDCPGGGWSTHFQGLAPFSTTEATALREFVQNHWICMAVDVHLWTQLIWNIWGTGDVAGVKMKERAVEIWDQGLRNLAERIWDPPQPGGGVLQKEWDPPQPGGQAWLSAIWNSIIQNFVNGYTLASQGTGTGAGQFTAWLAAEQHIQTFMIELPPYYNRVDPNQYDVLTVTDGKEFRYDVNDDSNPWHPSSSRLNYLIVDSFIPMAMYLIAQADAPGSATRTQFRPAMDWSARAFDTREVNGSPQEDFGILAAKIGHGEGSPGQITTYPAKITRDCYECAWYEAYPAFDFLYYADPWKLHYWVQNYGHARRQGNITLQLRSRPHDDDTFPWTVDWHENRSYTLREREKVSDSFSFELEDDRDYELSVWLHRWINSGPFSYVEDEFSQNNGKVFKFTTGWYPAPFPSN